MSFSVLEHPFLVLERLFPILERLFPVLERHFPVFLFFWEGYFVPGRDGTEEFVPGHLLLPLSRDKGTPGQEYFCPGTKGQRDVPSRGNPNRKCLLPKEIAYYRQKMRSICVRDMCSKLKVIVTTLSKSHVTFALSM